MRFVILAALLCSTRAFPQTSQPLTPAQIGARVAQYPPDQRAYERYRAWNNQQTSDARRAPDHLDKYRAYLKAQGFAGDDIEAQIRFIGERAKELEIDRWNTILTAEKPRFNTNPNAFLVETAKTLKPGAALDVGMGQGRNAIWLAQNGWTVTGFDPAAKAVALANQTAERAGVHLNTQITTSEQFDFGENRWDLILLSYVGARGLTEKIQKALKPHGVLVVEAFHHDAAAGRSIGYGVVFETGEMIKLFPNLRVVRYEEPLAVSDFMDKAAVRVVRYCGEKVE